MNEIINKLECNQILLNFTKSINKNDFKLINYETKQLKSVIGFMGEYHNLLIQYKLENEDDIKNVNFFVKKLPINKYDRKEIESNGAFRKEIGIYGNILDKLRLYCPLKIFPECYYTGVDVIVMENLVYNDYKNIKKEDYTINHYHTALDNLAALHTASILYEYKTKINIGDLYDQYLVETQIDPSNNWYTTGLLGIKTLAMIHPKFQNSNIQKFICTNLLTTLTEACNLVKRSDKYHNVFCHRDTWDSNILFKFDNNDNPINCVFVDYQLARYTPPAGDVLFFLYLNSTRNLRQKIINNYLKYYHNSLIKQLSKTDIPNFDKLITWNEFLDSCETIKLVILILKAICAPMCNIPDGWTNDMKLNHPEKFDYYMTCNRDEMLLELMEKCDNYKKIVLEAVEELIDYILEKYYSNF